MAMFIELTSEDERVGKILVNVEELSLVNRRIDESYTVIGFNCGAREIVKESYDEVKAKIREVEK